MYQLRNRVRNFDLNIQFYLHNKQQATPHLHHYQIKKIKHFARILCIASKLDSKIALKHITPLIWKL